MEKSRNNVPIRVAAKAFGKDQIYVRQGLIQERLPIGYAFKKQGASRYSYYISPKKLKEVTGFDYESEDR